MAVETTIQSRYILLLMRVELMDSIYPGQWSQEVRIPIRATSVSREKEVMLTGLQSSGDFTQIKAPAALNKVYFQTSQQKLCLTVDELTRFNSIIFKSWATNRETHIVRGVNFLRVFRAEDARLMCRPDCWRLCFTSIASF